MTVDVDRQVAEGRAWGERFVAELLAALDAMPWPQRIAAIITIGERLPPMSPPGPGRPRGSGGATADESA